MDDEHDELLEFNPRFNQGRVQHRSATRNRAKFLERSSVGHVCSRWSAPDFWIVSKIVPICFGV